MSRLKNHGFIIIVYKQTFDILWQSLINRNSLESYYKCIIVPSMTISHLELA